MVADELPKDLIPKFLEAIQEKEASIFQGMQVDSPHKSIE